MLAGENKTALALYIKLFFTGTEEDRENYKRSYGPDPVLDPRFEAADRLLPALKLDAVNCAAEIPDNTSGNTWSEVIKASILDDGKGIPELLDRVLGVTLSCGELLLLLLEAGLCDDMELYKIMLDS